jgi:hypothetical protein
MIKSKRMRWAGQGMYHKGGRRGMHIGYRWESQKERDYKADQDVGGGVLLML